MSTMTPEEQMKMMMAQTTMPTMPNMVNAAPIAAPGLAPMPTMPNMGNVAPVMAPVEAPQNVGVQPSAEQMAVITAQQNPIMAPNIEQPLELNPATNLVEPATVMEQPVQNTAQMAEVAATIGAMPTLNIGSQVNLQNGLDLDAGMTPEEQIKLEVAETVVNPIVIGGLESIGSCKTSVWAALITILDFIAKELGNNDIISIENGTIDTQREGIFIHCDMKNILGNISLNLTAPDKSVKLLKLIRGGELVQIFKEEATNSYIFCNIQDSKVLTRVKTSFAADQVEGFGKAPAIGNPIFQKEIPQSEKEIIKTIIAGRAAIGSDEPYRFGFSKADNTLVSIGVGKDFTHFFKDSSIETDEYRCFNPFPVPNMESCIIRFFKKADDNTTWIQTVSNINPSSIICTEKVELIDSSIEDFNFA